MQTDVFIVDAGSYQHSWSALKTLGIEAVQRGETVIDVSAWEHASSAHLAVLVFWWQRARKMKKTLTITGLNPTFQTLAELGGVTCIETGEPDAGH